MISEISALDLTFTQCAGIDNSSAVAAIALVEELRKLGSKTISVGCERVVDDVSPRINSKGNIMALLGLWHPMLAREAVKAPFKSGGTGNIAYLRKKNQLSLHQDLNLFE